VQVCFQHEHHKTNSFQQLYSRSVFLCILNGWAALDKNIVMQVRYGVYGVLEVSWSFVEWSCPSILWCPYLLLPWCYRHENWHLTPSST